MHKFVRLCACVLSLAVTGILHAEVGPLEIWYASPPNNLSPHQTWYQEALPIGNGKLAAMIYGVVNNEQIQFNEDTIWTGEPHYYDNTNSTTTHLDSVRNKVWNKTPDILSEAQPYLMALPYREASYQDAGSIALTFPHPSWSNYRRTLDLGTATVNVHYDYSGVTYNRDIFASAPSNKVIVVRLTASQAGKINFTAALTTQQTATFSTVGNDVVMHAKVTGPVDYRYYQNGALTNKVLFDARLRVVANGGSVIVGGTSITVTNADDATLYLAVASNYDKYNQTNNTYAVTCSNNIADASALGYSVIRTAQQDDYTNLFNRVVMDLGTNIRTNWATGARKKTNSLDGADGQFVAVDFQLGRYLMIAGSRPGSQALNLQGKWNSLIQLNGQWDSKMTLNINEEENYWGAEICNLSECQEPLFDMIQDLSETGHRSAGSNYFCGGWVAHHNTDLWRCAGAVNGDDGIWPTGGAWLCQHLWWHYLYTGDTNWLATVGYPLMTNAAVFFKDFLIHPPAGKGWNTNYLVTNPSYSPEHGPPSGIQNVPSPTMDNDLMRDLFSHVIQAGGILGEDPSFINMVSNLQAQLPPDEVGSSGQLQEWLQVDEGTYDKGHRHCSHLVGFFPGDQISTYYTPDVALGAKTSVDFRGYGSSSMTPWSISWRLNLRTRLQDGNGAMTNLMFLYSYNKVSTNLVFGDNHDQVDCVFGRLSGIATMFVQSPREEIILLPALPDLLTNGMVSGLCARGGFEVRNLTWTNGQLTGATILSKAGNVCNLRSKWPIDVKHGSAYVDAPMAAPGLYQFSTTAGESYDIIPAQITEVEKTATLSTSGDSQTSVTNAAFSNWRGTIYNANAASDYVSYGVSNVTAGTYRIKVVADAGNNRGQFQLSVGPISGSLTDQGSVQDTYSPTNLSYLLPIRINTVTNNVRLWTNQLTEFDCGSWEAPSTGDYEFKFTVPGKNAGSSGYALSVDFIKLTPDEGVVEEVPAVSVMSDGSDVVIYWPAPSTGYSLESTADITNAVWNPVLPAPTSWGGTNWVTNAVGSGEVFYRLVK